MRFMKPFLSAAAIISGGLTIPLLTAQPVAAQTYSSQNVTGENVKVAYFNGGRFEQSSSGTWYEYANSGGPRFTFRETHRDAWSVYLRDDSRNGDLQIDVHRKMISAGWDGSPRSDLYPVTRFASKTSSGPRPTPTPNPTPRSNQEEICYDLIQDKVAYDRNGNKRWSRNNVESLCSGTANPRATRDCFTRGIDSGNGWSQAIQSCKVNTSNFQSSHTPPPTRPTPPTRPSGGVVTMYQHCNYGGYSVSLPVGDFNLSSLQSKGPFKKV